MSVVGIHGIWQQQSGRQQLLAQWRPALADGLERAVGRPVSAPDLDVAYFGHLILPPLVPGPTKSAVDAQDMLADLSAEELSDLSAAVLEVAPDVDLDADTEGEEKALPAFPLAVQRLIRAVDRRFRIPVGALFLGELRQVRRYLCEPALKEAVDAIVAETVTAGTRILVGHSLGSVVALEYVRQRRDARLELLLTLGSPLALRMIRRYLPDPTYAMDAGRPSNVARWVNVHDPRDPVACAGGLRPLWSQVRDELVNNQLDDAHSVQRYLSKKITGAAILDAVPELAS